MDKAASEFRYQLQRDVESVTNRCRKYVDEADRLECERSQFVDAVEKAAATVRETVRYTAYH